MKKTIGFCLVLAAFAGGLPTALRADEVTDWNKIMHQAALVAPATSPLVMGRVAAIVQVSVFEAVNGIERRYTPVHAVPLQPVPGASRRAAAVQAAYAALVRLYPSQKSTFDAKLAASLAGIASDAAENSESIARVSALGEFVSGPVSPAGGLDSIRADVGTRHRLRSNGGQHDTGAGDLHRHSHRRLKATRRMPRSWGLEALAAVAEASFSRSRVSGGRPRPGTG